MKKKYLYSLLIPYMATVGALCAFNKSAAPDENAHQKKQKAYVYKPRELKMRIDTLNITDENFEHMRKAAVGGRFFVSSNTVVLNYFNALSDSSRVVRFCEFNNSLKPLFMRHELEHARKQDLVYNTGTLSNFACGEVCVADEISARVAEIIEAVDYHTGTGNKMPGKLFVVRADSVINNIPSASMPYSINYNYRPVADIVLTYALEGFLDAYNRGFYETLIRRAYNRKAYKKQSHLAEISIFLFNPDQNRWDPMWEFESNSGKCNPYINASLSVRQKLIQTIDSIVCDATGADKFKMFYKNSILR